MLNLHNIDYVEKVHKYNYLLSRRQSHNFSYDLICAVMGGPGWTTINKK